MKKLLIVGINGFAGQYLRRELLSNGYEVYGADLTSNYENTFSADMVVPDAVNHILREIRPDGIFNLSGFASPSLSWTYVTQAIRLNIEISVNLAMGMKEYCPKARLLVVGTSNQYDVEACGNRPIDENSPRRANDPYSLSKQAQEDLLMLLAGRYDLDIMITRSFNHIGVGQKKNFVVTDFASGIVDVERGRKNELVVGNLDSWRDFSDVRDSVRAYRLLYEKGHSGEIYNVGSGQCHQIRWILEKLIAFSTKEIPVICNTTKTGVASKVICNYEKLKRHTGFTPERNIETTLREVLEYYRSLPDDNQEGA